MSPYQNKQAQYRYTACELLRMHAQTYIQSTTWISGEGAGGRESGPENAWNVHCFGRSCSSFVFEVPWHCRRGGLTKPSKCFSGNFLALFTLNLSISPLPTSTSFRSEGTDTTPVACKLIKGDVIDPVVSGVWDRRVSKCLTPLCSPTVNTAFSPFAAYMLDEKH